MTTKRELKKRVKKGIEFLDSAMPEWKEMIEIHRLDLRTCHRCILGQVYGDYDDALYELGIFNPSDYGFTLSQKVIDSDNELIIKADFERLTNAWRELLK